MKKAIVVLALIAAAFAGGAVSNGQGLAWAKGLLRQIRIPSGDLNTVVVDGEGQGQAKGGSSPVPEPIPAAPMPPLVIMPSSGEAAGAPQKAPAPPAEPAPAATQPPSTETAQGDSDTTSELPKSRGVSDPAALSADPKLLVPPPTAPPTSPPPPPEPLPLSREALTGAATAQVKAAENGWKDAPGSAPARAVVPQANESQEKKDPAVSQAALNTPAERPETDPAPTVPSSSTWSAVRRRMQELGVTRYWVEGEPGGAAVFRCVIPLAGRRAVSQLFEAEGDDEIQAAEAALGRVALWRATERP